MKPFLLAFALLTGLSRGGMHTYVKNYNLSVDMPLNSDVFHAPSEYNAPQQVHITQGDQIGSAIIISWVTPDEPGSNLILYGEYENNLTFSVKGDVQRYTYYNYTYGYIHHCNINNLKYDTKYYYAIGVGQAQRKFSFIMPPKVGPDVPYTFGLIGDLGQTYNSNRTLSHYESNPLHGQTVLYLGDLAYADAYPNNDNVRWDTWGRFVERSVAYQPWIWTVGNHEVEFSPEIGEIEIFKSYKSRYLVPYKASRSTSSLWYSIKRASAYIIVLSSYSTISKYTPQYEWLRDELQHVNRTETPWLIILMHTPFYHSYKAHSIEGEPMRVAFEPWFVQYKVDVVFSGHVHAYERCKRISNIENNFVNGKCSPIPNKSAPVYITIGAGGNLEGLITNMSEPQPTYSAFREASFGHAIFDVKNKTHAYYAWHRNQDGYAVMADSMWFYNRFWNPMEEQ